MCREISELIKRHPDVQSLAVRVEGRAAEPQVLVRLLVIVAQEAGSSQRRGPGVVRYENH